MTRRRRLEGVTRSAAAASLLIVLTFGSLGAASAGAGTEQRAGRIAFLRFPDGVGTTEASLFVIRPDGTGLKRLTAPGSRVYGYEWSPTGTLIAYVDGGSLWVVRPDGTGRVRLVRRSRLKVSTVSWSPGGKELAVSADDASTESRSEEIYIVSVDGGGPRLLGAGYPGDPAWSPNGDEIAYSTPNGGVWVVRSDGSSSPRGVMRGTSGCYGPAWSADARRLAAACGDSRGRYAYLDVVNADGSNRRRLTKHAYNEYGFAWSPDGRSILYGRENSKGIYVIGADGRHDRRVTSDAPARIAWGALTWAPDGRTIAYATDRTGRGDLYVVGADGRGTFRLTTSSDSDIDPSWQSG